ncbi:2-oxo-4-hydroxy-4-carboxy-5-ureidoimidazoline decarboxylase [Amnibacterium kyonggiense]|uniref:2-oxo-4-hydroxy-4-carboxy-5-ureidoimidazoline decarboxylase n=1 Tax=Amnibacterium kyonggiense TaxID=595671 RepID=A0A4R7FPS8_9MICO|nr:2-oxo-4-hydroxy-4-carboxy-5-ureidoimidazoline decarboxylase [Amnibacterium kyonggiense]TDS79579.1 2-oxo-4-hydroxy-4-carboxy-5-ureidoimidazoline decarboxylase [Amnibacterium kyonggiense]
MIDTRTPEARERLSAALGIARWVAEVADGGPYATVDELVAAGEQAAAGLTDAELDEAVGHHPRIGERSEGDGDGSRLSAGEQAGLGPREEGVDAALARGNEVYEGRFGRVFLIRAAGRSRQEVLDELQRRLKNDDEAEAAEAKEQLRQIAALRIAALFEEA